MLEREPLEFKNAGEWRNWLSTHYGTAKEAWVVHYKAASLQKGLRYSEALPEAIAYGWIDGRLHSVNADCFMLRYTPRKTNSIWSKRNRLIAEELTKAGKMAPSGLAAVEAAKKNGNWSQAYTNLEALGTPGDLRKALEAGKIASENFARFPVSARNMYIRWIEGAKTDATRQARIIGVVARGEFNVKPGDIPPGSKIQKKDMKAIEGLFKDRPASLDLFNAVRGYIESLGPMTVEPMKTQVSFGARRKFAWVWLPQMWIKKQPENSIVLTIGLDRKVVHPKIKESVEPLPGRWTHHVVIESVSDLDDDVKGWLREAYERGQHIL